MARKIKLYSATSLNNRIARGDGSVDWLDSIPHPEGEDYGYYDFYKTIDSTIMGYATYSQVIGFDVPFPYKDKKNYVLTRKTELPADSNVEFVNSEPVSFISQLKEKNGKDIWLIGGGQVNSLLLNAGLVDELIIHVMPVILDGGIELFEGVHEVKNLQLLSSRSYDAGVVELQYRIRNA